MNVAKRTLVTLELRDKVRAAISAHLEDMTHLEDTAVHAPRDDVPQYHDGVGGMRLYPQGFIKEQIESGNRGQDRP